MTKILIKSIVFTLVTVLATVALAGTIQNTVAGASKEYTAMFEDATSLNNGDDVRMAGVKIGTVESIDLVENRLAKVTFTVSQQVRVSSGTTAELRFRNLVGQRYIALEPPEDPGPALQPGHTFAASATRPALDLTMLFNGFRPLLKFLSPEDVNKLSEQIIAVFQGEGATVEGLLASTSSLTQTIAAKDQVIGQLIDSLSAVLTTINSRSEQLDTTIITLQQLVSGLAEDREVIGSTLDGLGNLTVSVSDLLEQGRAPLKGSIDALGRLSENLSNAEQVLDSFFEVLPVKLDRIGRLGSYGSWLNFYVCSIEGKIPMPEGYMGDLGVTPAPGVTRCVA